MRPPLTTGALTIGMPRSLRQISRPVLRIHADQHAEAGGDEDLAVVIGDAAAHALRRVDGVGLAQQAPQGRHVGAVLGRQPLVPDRMAVGGAEDTDMGFGIQRIDQPAADHRRGGQMGIGIGALAGILRSRPGAAVPARPDDTWRWRHSRPAAASRDCDRAAAAAPASSARVGSGLQLAVQRHHRNAHAAQVGFLAAGGEPAADLVEAPNSRTAAAKLPPAPGKDAATRLSSISRLARRARPRGGRRSGGAAAWARRAAARCRKSTAPPLLRKAAMAWARARSASGASGSAARAAYFASAALGVHGAIVGIGQDFLRASGARRCRPGPAACSRSARSLREAVSASAQAARSRATAPIGPLSSSAISL